MGGQNGALIHEIMPVAGNKLVKVWCRSNRANMNSQTEAHRKRRIVTIGALLGLFIPVIWYGIFFVSRQLFIVDILLSRWTGVIITLIWPSSIMLLAITHRGSGPVVVVLSVVVNVILYASLAYVLDLVSLALRK